MAQLLEPHFERAKVIENLDFRNGILKTVYCMVIRQLVKKTCHPFPSSAVYPLSGTRHYLCNFYIRQ